MDKHAEIRKVIDELGITVESEFVPFNKSRNAKPNPKLSEMSLNWKIKLLVKGREIIATDYQAGIGHAPAKRLEKYVKGNPTLEYRDAVAFEVHSGREYTGRTFPGKPIVPDPIGVVHCLLMDAEAVDYPDFESWAGEFGFDPDSRKAESAYQACRATGLKLRAALGDTALARLREVFQDY